MLNWKKRKTKAVINNLCKAIHLWAKEKGHWDDNPSDGEKIVLMHSELSEAIEGLRKPHADEHCPKFGNAEIELADCVIRIMDFCEKKGYNLGEAISAKMQYNLTREYKHGKKF